MGILNARPKLNPNEVMRWKASANRVVSSWTTSGGQLVVTDHRVFFQPNRFDTVTGRKLWECSLSAITGVEAIARDGATLTGGVRKRLGIQTKYGVETFVVNNLNEKVTELRELFGHS